MATLKFLKRVQVMWICLRDLFLSYYLKRLFLQFTFYSFFKRDKHRLSKKYVTQFKGLWNTPMESTLNLQIIKMQKICYYFRNQQVKITPTKICILQIRCPTPCDVSQNRCNPVLFFLKNEEIWEKFLLEKKLIY